MGPELLKDFADSTVDIAVDHMNRAIIQCACSNDTHFGACVQVKLEFHILSGKQVMLVTGGGLVVKFVRRHPIDGRKRIVRAAF